MVQDHLCLLRDPSRQAAGPPFRGNLHPTAQWTAQQIIECCSWDRKPPRFLIHDRDGCYGATFDRRLRGLGITQIRTPFRCPRANAIAERWVRSVRQECLDCMFVLAERHLRRILAAYLAYDNHWRPHRSVRQHAPCGAIPPVRHHMRGKVVANPVLGGATSRVRTGRVNSRIGFLRPTPRIHLCRAKLCSSEPSNRSALITFT